MTDSPPDANEAAASQVLQAPSFSRSVSQPVSACPAHSFSDSASLSPSLPTPPSPPSLSLPSFFFSPSVTPHSQSICSLCVCSDQCWAVHARYGNCLCDHAVLLFLAVNTRQLSSLWLKNRCHVDIFSELRSLSCYKILKSEP